MIANPIFNITDYPYDNDHPSDIGKVILALFLFALLYTWLNPRQQTNPQVDSAQYPPRGREILTYHTMLQYMRNNTRAIAPTAAADPELATQLIPAPRPQ